MFDRTENVKVWRVGRYLCACIFAGVWVWWCMCMCVCAGAL